MSTPLHTIEVLGALAEGPAGLARDWACVQIALTAPAHFSVFPDDPRLGDVVLAASPPALPAALGRALSAGTPGEALASAVAFMGNFGALPQQSGPLEGALRGAMGHSAAADVWLALGLRDLGSFGPVDLTRVASVSSPEHDWVLPSLVLAVGQALDRLDEAAAGVAEGLAPRLRADPALLGVVLGALGISGGFDLTGLSDPAAAAAVGAERCGASAPVVRARGSVHRRAQAMVRVLLDGNPHPAAALLRALYAQQSWPALGLGPVAVAAWLATFEPDDVVEDVCLRGAEADGMVLSAARHGMGEEQVPQLRHHLQQPGVPARALVLALPVLTPDLAQRLVRDPLARDQDLSSQAIAGVAAAKHPEWVPPLLADPETRWLGLVLAAHAPVEEVLKALLVLPLPAHPEHRVLLATALASMGEQAALPALREVLDTLEGEADWARALASSILQLPVD